MPSTVLRGLYLPPEVLALLGQLHTDALLLLAEILAVHAATSQVAATDEHFCQRLNLSKSALGRHLKTLKDAGLIAADTQQSREPKRILTPLLEPGTAASQEVRPAAGT